MDYRSSVLARADELMTHAPGQVSVQRLSHIDQVRALRAATATLTETERQALHLFRLELMARLDGVRSTATPASHDSRPGIIGAVLRSLNKASSGMSDAIRTNADFDTMAGMTGSSDRLPAPKELLDAAEAWAIATVAADRVDAGVDVTVLQEPWLHASVRPA